MGTQHHDDYAWTWEPLAAALVGVALTGLLALHTARGLALWIAGLGFHWTPSEALITSVGGLLAGDVHAGLATRGAASIHLAWLLAAILTFAVFGGAGVALAREQRRRRFKGMASTGQAHRLLGVDRLRATRKVIRPDLYRKG